MPMSVKIVADSLNVATGDRITTVELLCPQPLWGEFLTHRLFSRNAGSGRAVPIKRFRETVLADPYVPASWKAAQKGMGATKDMSDDDQRLAKVIWSGLLSECASANERLERMGVCKKQANNAMRPFYMVPAVVTATEWRNFLKLRTNRETVEPDMYLMSVELERLMKESKPVELRPGEWHLPYVTAGDMLRLEEEPSMISACRLSAGRCAGVSFFRHGVDREPEDSIKLCRDTLESNGHWSPLEHPAMALPERVMVGNFVGWWQFRKAFRSEDGGDVDAKVITGKESRERFADYSPLE